MHKSAKECIAPHQNTATADAHSRTQ